MKFDLIPHSSATNSYALLEDVITVIEAEPKRFDWGDWLDVEAELTRHESLRPACGTVACIAGWTAILTTSAADDLTVNRSLWSVQEHAERWFPVDIRHDLARLFLGNGDYDNTLDRRSSETLQDYAARGIKAIRVFMEKHEAALKAHTIEIPRREA